VNKICKNPECRKEFRVYFFNPHKKYCTLGCRNRHNNAIACEKAKRPARCWVCDKPYDFKLREKKRTCCVKCEKILARNAKLGTVCKPYHPRQSVGMA